LFYDELFSVLKKGYPHKNSVNWKSVEAETNQNLVQYGNFKKSLSEIKPLFDKNDIMNDQNVLEAVRFFEGK